MHYPFPIGVSTVGRTVAPATGRLLSATTTGTTSTDRVEALVLNAIAGIATAKADGIENPTVGLLNLDGMRQVEIILKTLQDNGYPITFAMSGRADGGAIMRATTSCVLSGCSRPRFADGKCCDQDDFGVYVRRLCETVGAGYGPGVVKKWRASS